MTDAKRPEGDEQEKWYLEPMTEIASELSSQSGWTWEHSGRVARYAVAFAKKVGLDDIQMMAVQCGSLLHDVGKMVVPPELLNKVSKLSRDEWYAITKHPMASAQIIKSSSLAVQIASIARSHHEWYNGQGYPMGLKGDAIPLGARIVGLADACDAMSSDRPYRAALKPEEMMHELEKGSGVQFDPVLLARLQPLIESNLDDLLPRRLLNVVTDDPSLPQQLWFALYPHGWDMEVVGGAARKADAATESGAAREVEVITLIDGTCADIGPVEQYEANGPVLWLDRQDGEASDLQRPLDLSGVVGTVESHATPTGKKAIKVLLADPYHLFRQVLKQCLEENDDIAVVADVDSATDFRRARKRVPHDIAVVASDMLQGTFTTGTLRADDIPLNENEAIASDLDGPPVVILVSDEDLEDPRLAAKVWQPGASVQTNAYVYRGSPVEVLVEVVRSLTIETL